MLWSLPKCAAARHALCVVKAELCGALFMFRQLTDRRSASGTGCTTSGSSGWQPRCAPWRRRAPGGVGTRGKACWYWVQAAPPRKLGALLACGRHTWMHVNPHRSVALRLLRPWPPARYPASDAEDWEAGGGPGGSSWAVELDLLARLQAEGGGGLPPPPPDAGEGAGDGGWGGVGVTWGGRRREGGGWRRRRRTRVRGPAFPKGHNHERGDCAVL